MAELIEMSWAHKIASYAQSSQVRWAFWQWKQARFAFFFLGPSLGLRIDGDESCEDSSGVSFRFLFGGTVTVAGTCDIVFLSVEGPGYEQRINASPTRDTASSPRDEGRRRKVWPWREAESKQHLITPDFYCRPC